MEIIILLLSILITIFFLIYYFQKRQIKKREIFLSIFAHEIKTPLSGIISSADVLLKSKLTKEQQHYILMLKETGISLNLMLESFLNQNAYKKIEKESFNLYELSANLALLYKNIAKEKGLELNLIIKPAVPEYIKSYPLKLRHILQNLLSNAVKFTDKGKIDFIVSNISGDKIRFEIIDTGKGINEKEYKNIFKIFTRGSGEEEGFGIGLSVCERTARFLNSKIELESEAGKGSRFYFDIERIEANYNDKPVHIENKTKIENFNDKEVLIAEDNFLNRKLFAKILEDLGLKVSLAVNGQEAFEICQKKKFDLIFLDIRMPILDGIKSSKKIAQEKGLNQKTPIVALTSHSKEEEIFKQITSANFVDYLSKPLSLESLERILKKYLKK